MSKYILKHGSYDSQLCYLVEKLIAKGAVCVDVGANIGFWSVFLAKHLNAACVYSFEPEPSNLELLSANLAINSLQEKVAIYPSAVGASEGKTELFLSEDNAGDHQAYATSERRTAIPVEVKTLDSLLGSKKIDFIKMDIQGYEAHAFEGMQQILKSNPNIVILTEWWPSAILRAGRHPIRTLESLSELGFHFHLIDQERMLFREVGFGVIDHYVSGDHHTDLFISRVPLESFSMTDHACLRKGEIWSSMLA